MAQKNHNLAVYLFVLANLTFLSNAIQAQKPPIEVNTFQRWPTLGIAAGISNNGAYVFYTINNYPVGSSTLMIYNTKANTYNNIINGQAVKFTADSRKVIFMISDSLFIRDLSSQVVQSFTQVSRYSLHHGKKNDWLLISMNNAAKELVIVNLKSQTFSSIKNVSTYTYMQKHEAILVAAYQDSSDNSQTIVNYSIEGQKNTCIWKGEKANSIIIDRAEIKCAFIENINSKKKIKCLSINSGNSISLIDENAIEVPSNWEIPTGGMTTWKFSNDGKRLFFTLNEKKTHSIYPGLVTIWNYKDNFLQSQQGKDLNNPISNLYSFVINDQSCHKLTKENESWNIDPLSQNNGDTYIVAAKLGGNYNEWNWNLNAVRKLSLVNTLNGNRNLTTDNSKYPIDKYEISPQGKYFIYYDPEQKNYIAYDIQKRVSKNITKTLPTKWTTYYTQIGSFPFKYAVGICGYTKDDEGVLISDQYNIWLIDLNGKKKPINLTGIGNQKIIFSFALSTYPKAKVFNLQAPTLLKSFNLENKEIGFYSLALNGRRLLKKLTVGPYSYGGAYDPYHSFYPNTILKAQDSNLYLVQRESSKESPNYYLTSDFRSFKEISQIHPEKKYNWFSAELHTYTLSDGTPSAGILYKPENFDSTKKYPVIFQYYTESTHLTNSFLDPRLNGATLNIPIMIGKGYLVFKPDMHFQLGKLGEGALNSALAAYDYLKEKSYVDSTRIALNGHSMGGYETNYIIAHTTKFRAAISSSGFSDLIRLYGSIWGTGDSQQHILENGYGLMDGTLWEKKNSYISNSPIFDADKIRTPLLMMNNKLDGAVNFSQGVALFTALRRLSEPVWMLEYDNEYHSVDDTDKQIDFQKRMNQFLDHYIMDMPMPQWMAKGIPASRKGFTDGLELESK